MASNLDFCSEQLSLLISELLWWFFQCTFFSAVVALLLNALVETFSTRVANWSLHHQEGALLLE